MARLLYPSAGISYANSGSDPIKAGDVVVVGKIFGIAEAPIPVGATGFLATRGVYEFAKATATTADQGAIAYWDSTNSQITATASTNQPVGYFAKAATNGPATCEVLLGVYVQAASGSGS